MPIKLRIAETRFHSVTHFPVIDSTNTFAIQQAQAGADSGAVYIADEQTAGRGRGGHAWHSQPGDGLYLTVLLRPLLQVNDALKISLAAALACQQAISEACGTSIDLRWPNDLVIPQRKGPSLKCGGILTETASDTSGSLRYAVIGLGINLNHAELPPDLASTATSLRIATGHAVDREDLTVALLRALSHQMDLLEQSPASVLQQFAQRSTWINGKRVVVAEDNGYTGVTDGLSATGLLRVRLDNGSLREVRHGGVREAT